MSMTMRWICKLIGHWDRKGVVIQGQDDIVADYRRCRICGDYSETLRPGWRRQT